MSSPTAEQSLSTRLSGIIGELVGRGVTLEQARREFEKQFILASLRTHGGHVGRSAKGLGVHRNTLRNKLSSLGIDPEELVDAGLRRHRRKGSPTPRG